MKRDCCVTTTGCPIFLTIQFKIMLRKLSYVCIVPLSILCKVHKPSLSFQILNYSYKHFIFSREATLELVLSVHLSVCHTFLKSSIISVLHNH